MSEKLLHVRVQNKHKIESKWYLDVYDELGQLRNNPFIPLAGELIIFDAEILPSGYEQWQKDEMLQNLNRTELIGYPRFKVGDGITNVMDLPLMQDDSLKYGGRLWIEYSNIIFLSDTLKQAVGEEIESTSAGVNEKQPVMEIGGSTTYPIPNNFYFIVDVDTMVEENPLYTEQFGFKLKTGDWLAVVNNAWCHVDNTETITSVNGRVGDIVLTAKNIALKTGDTKTIYDKLETIEDGAQVNTVTSVAGKTGAISLDKSDIGLDNVENKSSATIRNEITAENIKLGLGYTPLNEKPNDVNLLFDNNKINSYYLPDSIANGLKFGGIIKSDSVALEVSPSATLQAELLDSTLLKIKNEDTATIINSVEAEYSIPNDYYFIIGDNETIGSTEFMLGDWALVVDSVWKKLSSSINSADKVSYINNNQTNTSSALDTLFEYFNSTDNILIRNELKAGVYTSAGAFSTASNYTSIYISTPLIPVPAGAKQIRTNYKAKRIMVYDTNKAKISNIDNAYAQTIPENGAYIAVSYYTTDATNAVNLDLAMLSFVQTEEGRYTNTFINKPYIKTGELNKKLQFKNKDYISYEDLLEYVEKLAPKTCSITEEAGSGAKVLNINKNAAETTTSTKEHFVIPFYCKPTQIVLLEFYGLTSDASLQFNDSGSRSNGALFYIKFYDKDYRQIGDKYNADILGEARRGYHRFGYIAPYGTYSASLVAITRDQTSAEVSDVSISIVNDVCAQLRTGIMQDSHLGVIYSAPRNTLPSFELSKKAGFTHCIANCNWTKDNVLVALHDDTIDATSNGSGAIRDMTYEEALQYDFGSWFDPVYTGTKIPKLEDVVKTMSVSRMIPIFRLHNLWRTDKEVEGGCSIELSSQFLTQIYSWVCRYNFKGQAEMKSFHTHVLNSAYEIMGDDVNYILCTTEINTNILNFLNTFRGNITLEIEADYALDYDISIISDYMEANKTEDKAKIIPLSAYTVNDGRIMRTLINKGITRFCSDLESHVIFPLV